MQYSSAVPSKQKVLEWMISTLQHSCRMEYYMSALRIGKKDFERPHDIVGLGNKYDWSVIRGLASGNDRSHPDVKESLRIHRKQYHHRMWNGQHEAEEEDMLVGALDAICSLIEDRQYQGGVHGWDGVITIAEKNPEYKRKYMQKLLPELMKIPAPLVDEINSLDNLLLANLAISRETKEIIIGRTYEAVQYLTETGRI